MEIVVRQLGLEVAKSYAMPSEEKKAEDVTQTLTAKLLDPAGSSLYRSLTMRRSYFARDRIDIAESRRMLARHIVMPKREGSSRFEAIGRILERRSKSCPARSATRTL